jgi:hypothetical protein
MKFPNRMPDFTPSPKHERPRGALETWSEANWAKMHALVRAEVELHLLDGLPDEVLGRWRDQHARGVRIGSDDPFFHLGVGMAIRNACREQLTDMQLLPVTIDLDGEPYGPSQNWDDYYFGVLAAIAA